MRHLTYNSQTGWLTSQPYLLPLAILKTSMSTGRNSRGLNEIMAASSSNTSTSAASSNSPSISTGFGDILSVVFLQSSFSGSSGDGNVIQPSKNSIYLCTKHKNKGFPLL